MVSGQGTAFGGQPKPRLVARVSEQPLEVPLSHDRRYVVNLNSRFAEEKGSRSVSLVGCDYKSPPTITEDHT